MYQHMSIVLAQSSYATNKSYVSQKVGAIVRHQIHLRFNSQHRTHCIYCDVIPQFMEA